MPSSLHARDFQVRRALTALLSPRLEPGTRLVHELGLNEGSVRIDVAVIGSRLEGYEIKAELDTLRRLARQVPTYSAVLDRCTLVVSKKHLDQATKMVPEWWGLMVAQEGDGAVRLRTVRRARSNPSPNAALLVKLLWRREALSVAGQIKGAPAMRTRAQLYSFLLERLSVRRLRAAIRQMLRERRGWRQPGRGRESGDGSFRLGASIQDFHASPSRPRSDQGGRHPRCSPSP